MEIIVRGVEKGEYTRTGERYPKGGKGGITLLPREIQAARPFLGVLRVPNRGLHAPIHLPEWRPRG